MVRSGVGLERAYDDPTFARAVEAIAPSGSLAPFAPAPPSAALWALPWTSLAPRTANLGFAAMNVVACLLALAWLLAWRDRGWFERSDAFVLAGAVLGSASLASTLNDGLPAGPLLLLAVWLLRAEEERSDGAAAVAYALFAVLSPWGALSLAWPIVWWRAGRRALAARAVGLAIAAALVLIATLGWDAHRAWLERALSYAGSLRLDRPWNATQAVRALLSAAGPASGALAVQVVSLLGLSLVIAFRARLSRGSVTLACLLLAFFFAPFLDGGSGLLLALPLWFALRDEQARSSAAWLRALLLVLLVLPPWPRGGESLPVMWRSALPILPAIGATWLLLVLARRVPRASEIRG